MGLLEYDTRLVVRAFIHFPRVFQVLNHTHTRIAAKVGGVEMEDVRVNGDQWKELKPKTKNGSMPFLQVRPPPPRLMLAITTTTTHTRAHKHTH